MRRLTTASGLWACLVLLVACGGESGVANPDLGPDPGETAILDAAGTDSGPDNNGNGGDGTAPGESGSGDTGDVPPYEASCKAYRYCLWACPAQDAACVAQCEAAASQKSLVTSQAYQDCLSTKNCIKPDGSTDTECHLTHCFEEYVACFHGHLHQTCVDLRQCMEPCYGLAGDPTASQACFDGCYHDGTVAANRDLNAMSLCVAQHCPGCDETGLTAQEKMDCDWCRDGTLAGPCQDEWALCVPTGDQLVQCGQLQGCLGTCPADDPGTPYQNEYLACFLAECLANATFDVWVDYYRMLKCYRDDCPVCANAAPDAQELQACADCQQRSLGTTCLTEYLACAP